MQLSSQDMDQLGPGLGMEEVESSLESKSREHAYELMEEEAEKDARLVGSVKES